MSSTEIQTIAPWIELDALPNANNKSRQSQSSIRSHIIPAVDENDGSVLPSPTTSANDRQELWNYPRSNLWKVMATFFAFVVMGANDSALGVCLFLFMNTTALN
jgi:hypothetical protein